MQKSREHKEKSNRLQGQIGRYRQFSLHLIANVHRPVEPSSARLHRIHQPLGAGLGQIGVTRLDHDA